MNVVLSCGQTRRLFITEAGVAGPVEVRNFIPKRSLTFDGMASAFLPPNGFKPRRGNRFDGLASPSCDGVARKPANAVGHGSPVRAVEKHSAIPTSKLDKLGLADILLRHASSLLRRDAHDHRLN